MFVVFEGTDGSGKTTVSNQVVEQLRASGISVKHLRAEGKFASKVSEAIRDLGRDARLLELAPRAEFLLYVARDVQLIEETLRPALAEHEVVFADRFLFTAEILGQEGRRLPREFTQPVLKAAAGGIVPDLVVLVDVDPVLARARRKAHKLAVVDKRPPSRKGLSGVGLQHRVRAGYLKLAQEDPEHWVVVSNEGLLEDTVRRVTELMRDALTLGVAEAKRRFAATATAPVALGPAPKEPADALSQFVQWVERRAEREPRVAAYLLGGLCGGRVDELRLALVERVPEAVLAALSGLTDPVSWQIREQLAERFPQATVRTLGGIDNDEPRALALREALEARAPAEVLGSLHRLEDERAWAQRERLAESQLDVVVSALAWLDSARAWALRERWLKDSKKGSRIESDYEAARTIARSVTGLGNDVAWGLRKRAMQAAPVGALWSLGNLDDAESMRWRREYLRRAPKVVMGTIKSLRQPEAWEMRRAVVEDCKEAIDSIQSMDDEPAWALRDAHRDRWPSTVVKSLGVLAESDRGRALIARQLATYPRNISLLKHVSAIALGLPRGPEFDD